MRRFRGGITAGVICVSIAVAGAQQIADPNFNPTIARPSHRAGQGPRVSVDAAHLNFHTADERYAPFARLLRSDGYRVDSNTAPFTEASLSRTDVLVIANAMHKQSENDWAPLPNLPAFADLEITEVERWVRSGGRLLLIADHMPLAGHAETLAAVFGIRFHNGFALDANRSGLLTFRRENESLRSTVATNGRGPDDRVDFVTTFTGQAFRVDPSVKAEPVLVLTADQQVLLPEVAFEFSDRTPRIPAANLLQGVLVQHGQGRIAVFGEAAMFSAQLAGPDMRPMGMNAPEARQNYRLVLNVMRWLTGKVQ